MNNKHSALVHRVTVATRNVLCRQSLITATTSAAVLHLRLWILQLSYNQLSSSLSLSTCEHILCHVQVSNDDALEFYQKFGFHIVDTKEQYYKRIDPPHAFVLQKDMKGPLGLPIVS